MTTQLPWPDDETAINLSCPCGKKLTLFWNGGELDQKTCSCGRRYQGRHLVTVVEVFDPVGI